MNLHGTKATTTWLLKRAGTSNREMARAARTLTNHLPVGSYRQRFNIPGPALCTCGAEETREHHLFDCPNWIRIKEPSVPVAAPPHEDAASRRTRAQRGWSAEDVICFLRLNPLVASFEWSEILSHDADDITEGRRHTPNEARLLSHTRLRKEAWNRFHREKNIDPKDTVPCSELHDEFLAYYDPEGHALTLHASWEKPATPVPPSPLASPPGAGLALPPALQWFEYDYDVPDPAGGSGPE